MQITPDRACSVYESDNQVPGSFGKVMITQVITSSKAIRKGDTSSLIKLFQWNKSEQPDSSLVFKQPINLGSIIEGNSKSKTNKEQKEESLFSTI